MAAISKSPFARKQWSNEIIYSVFDAINVIVLGDTDRVILINSNNGRNYINAVYVNGYKNKNAFVATQVPLEHTLAEYWLMVFECNIQTIVWVHGKNETEELPEYLPSLSSLVREGKMEVELLSDIENGGINEKKILLSKGEVRCLNKVLFKFGRFEANIAWIFKFFFEKKQKDK